MGAQASNSASTQGVMCGNHLKSPDDLGDALPRFPAGTKSLLSKFLTQATWDRFKNKKDKYGFSFKQAIFSGC